MKNQLKQLEFVKAKLTSLEGYLATEPASRLDASSFASELLFLEVDNCKDVIFKLSCKLKEAA